ncbi:MAG: glucan biosynthesis protein, partial [Burkholderiales bacterium]|nr:glucan biosynthesis protein [Burkholderiales bacterium]
MNPFKRIPGAVKRAHDTGRLAFFAAGAALALAGWAAAPSAHAFGFSDVAWRAQTMAAAPYKAQPSNLPKALRDLSYQQYREIRLKPKDTYWRGTKLPFELGFFHEGSFYDHPVQINEVNDGRVLPIRFNPDMFDYGANKLDPKQLSKLGFAGFRVHYALNTPKHKDEVLVFLGASYFRAVGKGQVYGLSARGLAIDTALSSGEEFPRFVDFWIVRPTPGAKELTIYALLDSPSVTGAYRFILRPGTHTEMDVKARIFMRANVSKLGIAPLTSMYLYGE